MSDYSKHRGHLVGQNREGDPKCFQCGEELHEKVFDPGWGWGSPTSGKPDVSSALKPSIGDYFYKRDRDDDED